MNRAFPRPPREAVYVAAWAANDPIAGFVNPSPRTESVSRTHATR